MRPLAKKRVLLLGTPSTRLTEVYNFGNLKFGLSGIIFIIKSDYICRWTGGLPGKLSPESRIKFPRVKDCSKPFH